MDLLNISSSQLLENFKSAYYSAYGTTLLNGSDDFISAGVMTYVLTVLVNAINSASNQRFLDTATGAYLDAIAEVNGISRPAPAHSSAVFALTPVSLNSAIPVHGLTVSNGSKSFTNEDIIYLTSTPTLCLLNCTESGSENNGIPVGAITSISSGGVYVSAASNTMATSGGDNGYPYTQEGDNLFREYIKNVRSAYVVGGSAPAYRAKTLETDNRIIDAYIAKDGDTFFEKGKVKIYTLYDIDSIPVSGRNLINEKVRTVCSAEDFRCIGDFIEVSTAKQYLFTLNASNFIAKYPLKFRDSAVAHFNATLDEYRKYLYSGFKRPFSESELAKRFITPDSSGVYALSTDFKSTSAQWIMPQADGVYSLEYPNRTTEPKPPISDYISAGLIQLIDTGE